MAVAQQGTVIGNETARAVLNFRIEQAAPLVLLQGLRWFYSPSTDTACCEGLEEITGLTNRTTLSRFTFSEFNGTEVSLTVSNLVGSGSITPGESDMGNYFLLVENPVGSNFAFITLIVFGEPIYNACVILFRLY